MAGLGYSLHRLYWTDKLLAATSPFSAAIPVAGAVIGTVAAAIALAGTVLGLVAACPIHPVSASLVTSRLVTSCAITSRLVTACTVSARLVAARAVSSFVTSRLVTA